MNGKRGHYRSEERVAIDAIEARRKAAGVTVAELALQAGMTERTLMSIRRSGFAFRRQINALRMAMRTLERDRRGAAALFPVAGVPEAVGEDRARGRK